MEQRLFNNRSAVLITMHKKEEVIFPLLKPLGMALSVFNSIDTDQFGSFTRDVPRKGSQLEAAQLKAKKALEISGADIAISSEGSFGPHPQLFFVPANIELILFTDPLHKIEVAGWEISTDTNFNQAEVTSVKEALQFSTTCGFPSHGIIVRPNQGDRDSILFKGITTEGLLDKAVMRCINASKDGKALIETDMRAMYNPTRMRVIEKAGINLLRKLQSVCPVCSLPGFEVTEWLKGLPCENCFRPTKHVLKDIYTCKKCSYRNEMEYPGGKMYCEAQFCDFCNP
jgi:hypothetical protein